MFSPALTGDQNVSDASVTNALLVYTKGDGTLAVGIDGYAAGTVYTDTALSANTEYHVTVTVSDDGTGNAGGGSAAGITIKMWVDGTAQALLDPNDASTVTGHPLGWVGVAAPNDGSVPIGVVTVGAYPDGNYGWEGSISGVTVDTGQLIQALYQHSATESSFYAEEIYPQMLATAWNLHFAATVRTLHMTCQHTC